MHRNNVSNEFLLFYLGHSMKSRRSQTIRIKGFFNRFLQRSRNAMTVNVNINFYYMEKSVLLGTKPLVDSIHHFIRDPSDVFSVCHLCECRIVQ